MITLPLIPPQAKLIAAGVALIAAAYGGWTMRGWSEAKDREKEIAARIEQVNADNKRAFDELHNSMQRNAAAYAGRDAATRAARQERDHAYTEIERIKREQKHVADWADTRLPGGIVERVLNLPPADRP